MLSTTGFRTRFVTAAANHADAFAIGAAAALPWSRTLTSILIVLWLIALVPALKWADLRAEISTPAGGLPALLFALAFVGMAWAEVSLAERLGGLDHYIRFLLMPLFIVHFRRSGRGVWVLGSYLASCTALLITSSAMMAWPGGPLDGGRGFGIPVNNAAAQVAAFSLCSLGLLFVAVELLQLRRSRPAGGALILALAFIANIFCAIGFNSTVLGVVIFSLLVIPLLVVVLAAKTFGVRAALGVAAAIVGICAAAWLVSPPRSWTATDSAAPLTERIFGSSRPVFWQRAQTFIADAPVLGHGTGSMPQLFARAAASPPIGVGATTHPHQQTLAVGIELGLIGMIVLWAMWIAHALLFRGNGLPAWIGLAVVTQGVAASLVGTFLFTSLAGWTYVIGVSVAAAMVRRQYDQASSGLST